MGLTADLIDLAVVVTARCQGCGACLLTCPEGHESRLLDAVERVDTAMIRIRDAGKVRARERIAVLAALNLAFEIADREAAGVRFAEATMKRTTCSQMSSDTLACWTPPRTPTGRMSQRRLRASAP